MQKYKAMLNMITFLNQNDNGMMIFIIFAIVK